MNRSTQAADAEVIVASDTDEHAAFAAELLGRAIHEAVQERGVARVALSGGGTPAPGYRRLASLDLPWDRVEWYWVDERAVPADNPRSNYRAALAELDGVAQRGRVHRMEAEQTLETAASRYQALLRERFGVAAAVAFDVMTLGVGDDGHTASLFPGTGAVQIADVLVAAIPAQPARGLEARLTLTAPVIHEARLALVLCVGAAKRAMVAAARAPGPEDEIPSRTFQRCKGRLVWLLDQAAAG
jgi:6-phosphogluconolactonase